MTWKQKSQAGLLEKLELRDHFVRRYQDRLAIWRKDGATLNWDEIQGVKNLVWGHEQVAIEAYPTEKNVVNIKNTRHLWRGEAIDAAMASLTHPEFIK